MKLTYEIPQGFTDEIRWFRFFSLRSLIVMVSVAAPGIVLIRCFRSLESTLMLIVFWFFVVAVITALTMIRMPGSRWLGGGGEYLDQILVKRILRCRKRCLYIKGYGCTKNEEEEKL